jgi:hypothetical protein
VPAVINLSDILTPTSPLSCATDALARSAGTAVVPHVRRSRTRPIRSVVRGIPSEFGLPAPQLLVLDERAATVSNVCSVLSELDTVQQAEVDAGVPPRKSPD